MTNSTKPFIWCLFSIANEHDQPDNNLVAWWAEKPTIDALARFMACPLEEAISEDILRVAELWKGAAVKGFPHDKETQYRLTLHGEGGL